MCRQVNFNTLNILNTQILCKDLLTAMLFLVVGNTLCSTHKNTLCSTQEIKIKITKIRRKPNKNSFRITTVSFPF